MMQLKPCAAKTYPYPFLVRVLLLVVSPRKAYFAKVHAPTAKDP